MAFTINGPGNAFMKVSDIGLNKATDAINNLFDIENPDGVQAALKDQLGILKAWEASATNDTAGVSGQTTTDKVESKGNVYYQNEVASEIFKVGDKTITLKDRPYSVFNKFSLVNYRGTPLSPEGAGDSKSQYYNKIDQNTLSNPTVSKIIEVTSAVGDNEGYRYDYSDFAMAKYFGKIPNNMMITLRRFAFPAPDDIVSPVTPDKDGINQSTAQPDIARAVTWLSEDTGNQISEILKFSTSYEWKEEEAAVQTMNSEKGKKSGAFGAMINDSAILRAGLNAAQGVDAYQDAIRTANGGYDAFSNTYPNHVFGPLNVIKNVLVRQQGLKFEQEFTLKFEYELRDLGGANPKILMLDQLSNILALTYSNAPFWGGSVRYVGDGSVARPLGDIGKLRSGDFKGFLGSVISDFTGQNTGSPMDDLISGAQNFISSGNIGKSLKNILGGAGLELFNSPQGGQAVNSLLTGDPTGQWHVTIGNPLNPIAVIGNLACTGTSINFEGGMGVQDFPEKMVVTVTLKPGRPRDKAEIESMFNTGRGRFYLQPDDTADINITKDVSAYGNKDKESNEYVNTFRRNSNG